MIQIDTNMQSNVARGSISLKYIVLLALVCILVLVNALFLYLLVKSPITVKNKSTQAKVIQKSTKDVLALVNPQDDPDKIRSVTLIVKDEKIAEVQQGTQTIPIILDPTKTVNENGNYTITLGVDKARMKNFSTQEQNEILNSVILMYLLSKSKPNLTLSERGAIASQQVDTYEKNNSFPFTIESL